MVGRRSHRAGRTVARRCTGAVAVLMLLVACADAPANDAAEPPVDAAGGERDVSSAPAGLSVGVVLPPSDVLHPATIDEIRSELALVRVMSQPGVREIRLQVPDEQVFAPDLARFLAHGRADLTCAMTPGMSGVMRELRAQLPTQRFCAMVTATLGVEEPEGFDLVVLRTEQLGHVVGAAAAQAADPAAVAVALSSHELERGRFDDGLRAALAGTDLVERDLDLEPAASIADAVDRGAGVVVIGSRPDAIELAEAAIDAGALVVVPDELVDELGRDAVVVSWRILWNRLLRGPVDRLLERDQPAPIELGLEQGVFVLRFGEGTPAGVNAAVGAVIDEIVAGTRDPLDPVGAGPVADPDDDL